MITSFSILRTSYTALVVTYNNNGPAKAIVFFFQLYVYISHKKPKNPRTSHASLNGT